MTNQDWENQGSEQDDTAADNTETCWEPIPDEIWFSSPAGDFGMEDSWQVEADLQEAEAARLTQSNDQPKSTDVQSEAPSSTQSSISDSPKDPTVESPSHPDKKTGAENNASSSHATQNSLEQNCVDQDELPSASVDITVEPTRLLTDIPTRRVSNDDPTVLASPLTDAAAEAADRTTVVGGGNPYRVAPQQQYQAPTTERTQVWAAPYAGQAGYESAASNDTATTRRPSILKRRKNKQTNSEQAPYYAPDAYNARVANDSSPVPPAQGGRTRNRERKRPRHGCLSMILWLIMLAVAGLMSLRTLSADQANGAMVPELVAFIPFLFAPIVVCLLLALLWHRHILAVGCLAAFAVMFSWHAGFFIPTARVSSDAIAAAAGSPSTGDNVARVMTVNTNNGMASAQEIVDICREQNVEILCLQELGGSMLDDLEAAGIDEVLPYSVVSDQATQISNGGRNGIWSAAPMDNISSNLLPIETSSMPAADITIGNQTIRVVSIHPNSPVRGAQDLWDDGLATIGQLQDYDHSYVIMGDFNSTWNHARFRELLGTSFVDAGEQSGEGFHMTFPSSGPIPPLVELDHILYTKDSGVVVSELSTVEISGTDHMALLGTLETT